MDSRLRGHDNERARSREYVSDKRTSDDKIVLDHKHVTFATITFFVIPAQAGIHGLTLQQTYFVYVMASQKNGTIYIGVTNDLYRRAHEHREKLYPGFSEEKRTTRLVYYEQYVDVRDAIKREKQLKKWNRAWKINLIEQDNPEWRDLWFDLNR